VELGSRVSSQVAGCAPASRADSDRPRAAGITAEIAARLLREGDRIPTGIHAFRCQRNVVREAIAGFRSDGVVRSRQGRGNLSSARKKPLTLRITAAVAALRANDEQRARITEAFETMKNPRLT
jgi:DNA-binding FadR family transcriptional regulator